MSLDKWSLHQTTIKYACENLSMRNVDGRRCSDTGIETTFDELNSSGNDVAYTIEWKDRFVLVEVIREKCIYSFIYFLKRNKDVDLLIF